MISSNYSLPLLVFYGVSFIVFSMLLYVKTRSKLSAFLLAFLIVLVGSEYYEIPIFVCGYLRVQGYGFPHVLHHINTAVLFVLLLALSRMKPSKRNIVVLSSVPFLISPLLLWFRNSTTLYLARCIGLTTLLVLVMDATSSPGVGGKNASKTPYTTNCLKSRI